MRLAAITAVAAISLFSLAASAAPILTVLTPVAAGTAIGSDACHQENAFDNQPTWDGLMPVNSAFSGNEVWAYGGRYCYMDFGADWADWRVVQTWTRYRQWSTGDQRVWAGGYWVEESPAVTNVIGGTLTEFGLKFQTSDNVPLVGTPTWYQDSDMAASPWAPSGRYLVMQVMATPAAGNDPRGQEYAMIGYKVPEPATMSLLGVAGLALLRRRR